MIKDSEIEELKKHLDENGKLIISDDLTDKQKERFNFINDLGIDLIAVLSRKTELVDYGDEPEETSYDAEDDSDDFEDSVEDMDDDSSSLIEEDDSASVENLDDFF